MDGQYVIPVNHVFFIHCSILGDVLSMVFPHGGSNMFFRWENSWCIRDGFANTQICLGHLSGLCNSCRDAVGRLTFLGARIFCGRAIEKKYG